MKGSENLSVRTSLRKKRCVVIGRTSDMQKMLSVGEGHVVMAGEEKSRTRADNAFGARG